MRKRILSVAVKLVLLGLLLATSYGATALLIDQARAEHAYENAARAEHLARARDLDPREAQYAKGQGDFYLETAVPPRLHLAAAEYREAVRLTPYEALHWADWGKACWRLGRFDEADKAYDMAVSLDPMNYKIQQEYGDYLFSQGRIKEAQGHHARAIQLNHNVELARSLCAVYWNLGYTPLDLATQLLGDNPVLLRRYFLDCLTWMDLESARALWAGFRQRDGFVEASPAGAYFDFLIAKHSYDEAKSLWSEIARDFYKVDWDGERERFWNGDFRLPVNRFRGGLEWRIHQPQPKGVRTVVSESATGDRSKRLWVHFDGKENVAYGHTSHLLLVEPGQTYTLSYNVFAVNITAGDSAPSDQGPYVHLALMSTPPVVRKEPMITDTADWDRSMDFLVPPDCHVAWVRICRDQSEKMNNRINGDVWYSNFTLKLKDEISSGTVEQ